jgi:NAD(P)H-hydrate epimerase
MTHSLTRAQIRSVDARAIGEYGMPGVVLMENAGRGAAELLASLGIQGRVVICAGKGNNGGDGFVIARHLAIRSVEAPVLLSCRPEELTGDAAINYRILAAARHSITVVETPVDQAELDRQLASADWIVDALLGTGTQGSIREPYLTAIAAINRAGRKVFAVDLPSGMDCDTGLALGDCVRADHTATFVARKIGFDHPVARQFTGQVHVVDIGVPRCLVQQIAGS